LSTKLFSWNSAAQVKAWEDSGQLLHRNGVEGAGEPLFDWKVLERSYEQEDVVLQSALSRLFNQEISLLQSRTAGLSGGQAAASPMKTFFWSSVSHPTGGPLAILGLNVRSSLREVCREGTHCFGLSTGFLSGVHKMNAGMATPHLIGVSQSNPC